MDLRFDTLDLERDGAWLTVWFNSPEKRNPLSSARVNDLLTLCDALADSDLRGVRFRGRGAMFCAGGDLSLFRTLMDDTASPDAVAALSRDGARLFDAISALPQITVCVAEGAAMAGGLGLASICDVVIAAPDCRFALSEVRIGLVAAQIAPFVVARIGVAQARRLMVLGAAIDAGEALRIGLVDHVTAAPDIPALLDQIKTDAMQAAPGAVAATKALLAALPGMDRTTQIDTAAQIFARAVATEGRGGIAAFAAKRPPLWTQET